MNKILLIVVVLGVAQWWFKDPTISVPSNDVSFGYVVKVVGSRSNNAMLPMLVALHGNGDTADNFYDSALDQLSVPVRIILLKGPIPRGRGSSWPWSAADFEYYGKAVSEAVELLALKYPTAGKPILLGFSGGGMMAYYQSVNHGNQYAYIFPISGQLSYEQLGEGESMIDANVHAFHGKSDTVVSVSGGRKAVSILQEQGVDVDFTEFDGGHHGIFTNMKSQITLAVEEQIGGLM
jgi:phospholipase/carboxylesterase